MVRRNTLLGIALIGTAPLLSGAAADAAVVFQDTFEDTMPVNVPDNPQVGSYPTLGTQDPESQVRFANDFPRPPALDASAHIVKIADKQRNYGIPTVAAVTGETITYGLDLYPSVGITSFGLLGDQGNDSADTQNISIWIQVTETKVQYRTPDAVDPVGASGDWNTIAGLVPALNTWEQYSIDYTVGDSTFDLTVGAITYSALGINAITAPTLIDRFILASGGSTGTVSYVDNPLVDIVSGASLDGDLDGDGFVGIADLNIVLGAWNQNVPPADPAADPSGDGFIGIEDLNTVLGNWNAGTPPTAGAVPEPASLGLLAAGGLLLLRRTR